MGAMDAREAERNEWRIGDYEVGRLIGSGMIGVVAVARHYLTHEVVCLKCMEVDKIIEKGLMRNVQMECDFHWELLGEDNIMPLKQLIVRPQEIIMVLPYISGRDLYGQMRDIPDGHLDEASSKQVFRQVFTALKACHARKIVHRDIKPENIMIDHDLKVYLSDFGLAIRLPKHGTVKGRAGTPCYYPYEMVQQISYDCRSDLWCLGVLLFEMLYGCLPFKPDEKTGDYAGSIAKLEFEIPKKPRAVSRQAGELIKRLLVKQEDRASLEEIESHPWLA